MALSAGYSLPVLPEIYMEAWLVDEEMADQIWEVWEEGKIDDQRAWLSWWLVTLQNIQSATLLPRTSLMYMLSYIQTIRN